MEKDSSLSRSSRSQLVDEADGDEDEGDNAEDEDEDEDETPSGLRCGIHRFLGSYVCNATKYSKDEKKMSGTYATKKEAIAIFNTLVHWETPG